MRLDYEFPIHVDEWKSWAISQQIENDGIPYTEPYLQQNVVHRDLEIGTFLSISIIQQVTGIPWLNIFRFMPVVLLLLSTLTVYCIGKRENIGLESALVYTLIPTSVRLLGPVFLVPVSFTLLSVLIGILLLTRELKTKHILTSVSIITLYLAYAYPPALILLGFIVLPFIVFQKRFLLSIPFFIAIVVSIPQHLRYVIETEGRALSFTVIPVVLDVAREFGVVLTALFVIGVYLVWKHENRRLKYFSITSMFLLVIIFLFHIQDFSFLIPPTRAYFYLMVLMVFPIGYTIKNLIEQKHAALTITLLIFLPFILFLIRTNPFTKPSADWIFHITFIPLCIGIASIMVPLSLRKRKHALTILCLTTLIIAIVIPAFQRNLDMPYYNVIDEHEYTTFLSLKEQYTGGVVAIDPWKALAFTPLTGLPVYSRIGDGPNEFLAERNQELNWFFEENCENTTFIENNNIGLFYPDTYCTQIIK